MEENKILYLGRISPIKNFETVIKAFPLLEDKEITLELVGPGEEEYFNKLKSLIKELNLENRITFSPAIYDIKEKIKKFDSCSIFILPSKSEGMPQSLIEAMARKKLVVAANNKAAEDLIEDEKNGFLFNIGDEQDLSKTINKILKLSNEEKLLIKNKARVSVEKFSWNNIIKKFDSLISN